MDQQQHPHHHQLLSQSSQFFLQSLLSQQSNLNFKAGQSPSQPQYYFSSQPICSSKTRSSSLPTWHGESRNIQSSTPISPMVSVNISSLLEAKQHKIIQGQQTTFDPVNPLFQKKIFLNMSTRSNILKPTNKNSKSLTIDSTIPQQQPLPILSTKVEALTTPPPPCNPPSDYEHKKNRLGEFLLKIDSMNTSMKHIEQQFIQQSSSSQEEYEGECSIFQNSYQQLLSQLIEFNEEAHEAAKTQFELIWKRIETKREEIRQYVKEISELSDDVSINLSNILSSMTLKPFNEILDNYDNRIAEINISLQDILSHIATDPLEQNQFYFSQPSKCIMQLNKILIDRHHIQSKNDSDYDTTQPTQFYTHSSQLPIPTNYTIESQGTFKFNGLSETVHYLSENLNQSNKKKQLMTNTIDSTMKRSRTMSQQNELSQNHDYQQYQSCQQQLPDLQVKSYKSQETEIVHPISTRSVGMAQKMSFNEIDSININNYSSQNNSIQQNENSRPNITEFNRQSINLSKLNIDRQEEKAKKKDLSYAKISWNSSLANASLNYHSSGGVNRRSSTNATRYQSLDSQKYAEIIKRKQYNYPTPSTSSVYQAILKGPNLPNYKQAQKTSAGQYLTQSYLQQQLHNTSIQSNSHQNSMQTEFNDLNSHNISIQ